MNDDTWSIQDAKNHFSELVTAAGKSPQIVAKHGKAAVVVVAADEFHRLKKLAKSKRPNFVEHLLAMPKDGGKFERTSPKYREVDF